MFYCTGKSCAPYISFQTRNNNKYIIVSVGNVIWGGHREICNAHAWIHPRD